MRNSGTNRQLEGMVQTIKDAICRLGVLEGRYWSDVLSYALIAMHMILAASYGMAPFTIITPPYLPSALLILLQNPRYVGPALKSNHRPGHQAYRGLQGSTCCHTDCGLMPLAMHKELLLCTKMHSSSVSR